MEQQNLPLKKAVKQYGDSLADPKQAAATVSSGEKAWKTALEAFMASKSGCRPNTIKWTSSPFPFQLGINSPIRGIF